MTPKAPATMRQAVADSVGVAIGGAAPPASATRAAPGAPAPAGRPWVASCSPRVSSLFSGMNRREAAPRRKITVTTISPVRWGRSSRNRPATTATVTWTKNADEAPSQTSSGRPRAPITSVAIIVLSGSSATAINTNTVAMTESVTRECLALRLAGAAAPAGRLRRWAGGHLRQHAAEAAALASAERGVDAQPLEGLVDAALARTQRVLGRETGDVVGQCLVAAQDPQPGEHPRVAVDRESGHDVVPRLLQPLPGDRAVGAVGQEVEDDVRRVLGAHLAQRQREGAVGQILAGEVAQGAQVALLLLGCRGRAVAGHEGLVVGHRAPLGHDVEHRGFEVRVDRRPAGRRRVVAGARLAVDCLVLPQGAEGA